MALDLEKIQADMTTEPLRETAGEWLQPPPELSTPTIEQQVRDSFGLATQMGVPFGEAEKMVQEKTWAGDIINTLKRSGLTGAKNLLRAYSRAINQPRVWDSMAMGTAPILTEEMPTLQQEKERLQQPAGDPFESAAKSIEQVIRNHPEWETEPPKNFVDLITSPRKLTTAMAFVAPARAIARALDKQKYRLAARVAYAADLVGHFLRR